LGSRTGSETTAAAAHEVGVVRRDPMAMLPFCGYNMADYFRHWLDIGRKLTRPPKVFSVNWFKVDDAGSFLWPGFGENIRVLKWVVDRVNNQVDARETAIGYIPHLKDLDLDGLNISKENLEKLFEINPKEWQEETEDIEKFLKSFGGRMPQEIWREFNEMKSKLRGG
ncbi:MAG: phosphoenolpyruvate carboxykinase domain-containing protein, partial [Candidatus Omnitrophota bacterium]|nr:phosphoenolpyruvate carboxykinase domain-containing protein [Candidatus Omnitrophota bacterium]